MTSPTLQSWQSRLYQLIKGGKFISASVALKQQLTLLAYHFWDDNRIETEFWRIEFSFLCAFRTLGLVKYTSE